MLAHASWFDFGFQGGELVGCCTPPSTTTKKNKKKEDPHPHPPKNDIWFCQSVTLSYMYIYVMSAWQPWQHVPPVMAAPFSPWWSTVCGQHQRLPPPHHGTPLRTPSLPPGTLGAGLQCSPAHCFQVLWQIWKGQGSGKHWCNNSSKNNGNDSVEIWMQCVLNWIFLLHDFCVSLWYTLKPDEALGACVEQSKQRELISTWKLSHELNSRDLNHWW